MNWIEIAKIGDQVPRPQKTSLESQIQSLPPDVRSVAESLARRDMESAKRYVSQYLSANRGMRS
jgi:hypothetical protein